MTTLGGILNTARGAIAAHQTAITVTSHNIANAETPGYTRQRAALTANVPVGLPIGQVGTGVTASRIERIRDPLLDTVYRREAGNESAFAARRDVLQQVEGIFAEPGESGLSSSIDAFWAAWDDLANLPNSATARGSVQQRGTQLAMALNQTARRLDEVRDGTRTRIAATVQDVNRLTKQVGELNTQIVAAEAGGRTASDLRDARDRVLDELGQHVELQVSERPNGAVGVFVGGATLVDNATVKPLTLLGADPVRFGVGGSPEALPAVGGSLGAMARVLNEDLPRITAELDTFTAALVEQVNAVHREGWSPAGDPAGPSTGWAGSGVDFFDPASLTAASIALAGRGPDDPTSVPLGVRNDAAYVAAGNVRFGTGNNAVALRLAALKDSASAVTPNPSAPGVTQSFRDYYRGVVTGLALETESATNSAEAYGMVVEEVEFRRQSVAGVSNDEEMTNLIRQQQAYVAATRIVSTVDEMAQSILNMV